MPPEQQARVVAALEALAKSNAEPNRGHRPVGTEEVAAKLAAEALVEMELDGLDEDQVTALAELEVQRLGDLDGDDAQAMCAARMEDARAKVRATHKVRKKCK